MIVWQILALLGVHFVADFVCQTHWQASNKSKNFEALLRHVGSYTLVLAVAVPFIAAPTLAAAGFVALNAVCHLYTDHLTSRWTSALWAKQDWHNFFVVIGLDQLIHQVTLIATFTWLLRG